MTHPSPNSPAIIRYAHLRDPQTHLLVRHDLPKTKRLLNAADFSRVFNQALFRVAHPRLLLLARPSLYPCSRLGLVIAKKHVQQAVNRNRIKRIIRESFRTLVLQPATMPKSTLIGVTSNSMMDNGIMGEGTMDKATTSFSPALDIVALARPGLAQLTNNDLHQLMDTQWQTLRHKQSQYNQQSDNNLVK